MGTTVILTLTGHQRDSEGEETITKTSAAAEYYEKNGTLYLLYDENPESGEITAKIQQDRGTISESQHNRETTSESSRDSETASKSNQGSNAAAKIRKGSESMAKLQPGSNTVIHNRIKYRGNLLEVTRHGAVNTRMVFECGREHMTDYATPFGCLRLGILTHSLKVISPGSSSGQPSCPSVPDAPKPDAMLQDNGSRCLHDNQTAHPNEMSIHTSYSLTAEGQPVSECMLEIKIHFQGT